MKFNFNLKGREPAGARYALIKAGLPETQSDLFKLLLSTALSVEDALQENSSVTLLREAVRQGDPEFLARMAIYLREDRSFRDVSFLLTAELAALYDDERTGLLVGRVVAQAGEIPGWLHFYTRTVRKRNRPGYAVRKHLSMLLNRLDEYQFSRYNAGVREGLRQALEFLRPKAVNQGQKRLFARILRGQVPLRTTWEQEWLGLYQQYYDSNEQRQVTLRDKWKEGISSFRIGYPALLKNLPAMLCAGVSGKVLKLAAEYLGNEAAAGPDGQSPLDLLKAWRSLQHLNQGGVGMLKEALERAALHNRWTRADFGRQTRSLIALDVSNSMKQPVDKHDRIQRFDIGPLLAHSWKSRGDTVITGIIGNTWRLIEEPHHSILSATDRFRCHEGEAGYAINAWLILQDLLRKKQVVDNVLIFTDCRLWNNRTFNQPAGADLGMLWRHYRRQLAPRARLYLFDLAGYGLRPLEMLEDEVYLIAGWQDRIPDVLWAVREDRNLS